MKSFARSGLFLLLLFSSCLTANVESIKEVNFNTAEGEISGLSLEGQVVYVDFWASWCKPCLKSFPWMNSIQQRYRDRGFRVIAVNVDKEDSHIDKFLNKAPAEFTVAFDPKGDLARTFDVKAMPSSFLFDRNGLLVSSHLGFREKKIPEYESNLEILLKAE